MNETFQELYSIIDTENFSTEKLNNFYSFQSQKKDYSFDKKIVFERLLENGLNQKYVEIRNVIDFYYLNVIQSNGELIYLKFYSEDSVFVERKQNKHNIFNCINNEIELPLTIYEYGIFCGIAGIPPEKGKEMLNFVSVNNYKILSEWLSSLNPEIALYGYLGLSFLDIKGIKIGKKEIERMEIMRKSDVKIYTCEGCLYGEMKTMEDIIKETNFNNSYDLFRQSRWLK